MSLQSAEVMIQQNARRVQVQLWSVAEAWRRIEAASPDCWRQRLMHATRWLLAVCDGMRHEPYLLAAEENRHLVGLLPLAYVRSLLFGRFLVSVPYVSSAGVVAEDDVVAARLIDRAVELAEELDVRHLELRHERAHPHAALAPHAARKVHMRLSLPDSEDALWKSIGSKVRNQVRKGQNQNLAIHWGHHDLLDDFYAVFSRNMRDLGTPVFSRRLFDSILKRFPDSAELCVVRQSGRAIAAALLVHGDGTTEVPSASSLREFNSTNANMLMYWRLLNRAIERGQKVFDFGRSTMGGNTYRFKEQWNAQPQPAAWQCYIRRGRAGDMRPENSKFQLAIRLWRRLPVALTQIIGPPIVRGIP
jgi:FemAB-related protein (PEP-CTERM system-associated)